jgi:hypothetical protein
MQRDRPMKGPATLRKARVPRRSEPGALATDVIRENEAL